VEPRHRIGEISLCAFESDSDYQHLSHDYQQWAWHSIAQTTHHASC
jgi:hypothetical protein